MRRTSFLARVRGYFVVLERYDFAVHEAWRGTGEPRISLVAGFSNCDFYFAVGTRYLVFARPTERPDLGLGSSICLPTERFQAPSQALSNLGPGLRFEDEPVSAETSFQRLYRHVRSSLFWGVATSLSVVNSPAGTRPFSRPAFLMAPLGLALAVSISALLAVRRRWRLLGFVAVPLFLATVLLIGLQGLLFIRSTPLLWWALDSNPGA